MRRNSGEERDEREVDPARPLHRVGAGVALGGVLAVALAAVLSPPAEGGDPPPIAEDSGFRWIDGDDSVPHAVERERVQKGIPRPGHPRDLIPPIDDPAWYASPAAAEKDLALGDSDRILAVDLGGDVRAYPVRILDRHEVVNDTVGSVPIAVLW